MSSDSSDDDGPIRATNTFAGLMSDSNDYSDEDPPAPPPGPIPSPVVPPRPAKKGPKQVIDEEAEYLELMKASHSAKPEPKIAPQRKLQFNFGKELMERYGDNSCLDCTVLPRNAAPSKFIVRRKGWPVIAQFSFKTIEVGGDSFRVELTEYGQQSAAQFQRLQEARDATAMWDVLMREPFNVMLLMAIGRLKLFTKEFIEATDFALRLTFLLQQAIPGNFVAGLSRFSAPKEFFEMIAFIARFAFRRGCFVTSNELWKFAALNCGAADPAGVLLSAAVPALFAEDLEFISAMIASEATFRGIPLRCIPDWTVCEALLSGDAEKLAAELTKWPYVFGLGPEPGEECPPALLSVQLALRRRILPILDKDHAKKLVRVAQPKIEEMDELELTRDPYDAWVRFPPEDSLFGMLVEEDALPVNPGA
jgi:hypothetical protein